MTVYSQSVTSALTLSHQALLAGDGVQSECHISTDSVTSGVVSQWRCTVRVSHQHWLSHQALLASDCAQSERHTNASTDPVTSGAVSQWLCTVRASHQHWLCHIPPRWPSGKASASRAEDPRVRIPLAPGFFSGSSHTSDSKIGTPVATQPGAWRYRVSAGTGRPGVSIPWLGEVERLICNFYLSTAARRIVWADPSLRYTSLLLGC